jgi:hypothetical protein
MERCMDALFYILVLASHLLTCASFADIIVCLLEVLGWLLDAHPSTSILENWPQQGPMLLMDGYYACCIAIAGHAAPRRTI